MSASNPWGLALFLFILALGCDRVEPSPANPVVDGALETASGAVGWSAETVKQMEQELGISVPQSYQQFVINRIAGLTELKYPLTYLNHPEANTERFVFDSNVFYFDPGFVTSRNLDMRGPNSMVGYAFPNWWETYFIVATDGGSGMFALRLDGEPTIWWMECDGGRIERAFDSFDEYVDDQLKRYHHDLPLYESKRRWFEQVQRGEMTREEFEQQSSEIEFWD